MKPQTLTSKIFGGAVMAAVALSCAQSFATDWIYDATKGANAEWATTIGTTETDGYWYDKANPTTYIKGSYDPADTFTIGNSTDGTTAGNIRLWFSKSAEIGALNMISYGSNNVTFDMYSNSLTVNGDLNRTVGGQCFINGINVLTVKGNLKIVSNL